MFDITGVRFGACVAKIAAEADAAYKKYSAQLQSGEAWRDWGREVYTISVAY